METGVHVHVGGADHEEAEFDPQECEEKDEQFLVGAFVVGEMDGLFYACLSEYRVHCAGVVACDGCEG